MRRQTQVQHYHAFHVAAASGQNCLMGQVYSFALLLDLQSNVRLEFAPQIRSLLQCNNHQEIILSN